MPIGVAHYPRRLVSSFQQSALTEAIVGLLDDVADDLAWLKRGRPFEDLVLADHLPSAFRSRYDEGFARRFFVTLTVVAWKLRSPDAHTCANVAEQIALHAIVDRAEAVLEEWGEAGELHHLIELAGQPTEFLALFDPALEDLKPSEVRRRFYLTPLDVAKWFEPLDRDAAPHPYTRAARA